jgi:hypothetical protein
MKNLKKLLFLFLLSTTIAVCQESTTIRYNYVVVSENGTKASENSTSLIIIYNYSESGDIMLINSEGEKIRVYITEFLEKNKNTSGETYSLFEAIYSDLGIECFVQIFHDDFVFRLIFKNPIISFTYYKEE